MDNKCFQAWTRRVALAGLASVGACGAAFGQGTDCGPYKITAIQAQGGDLLVNAVDASGNYWKEIGPWTAPATKSYQALLQQALMTGGGVLFRYTAPYNCNQTDYATVPAIVRLYGVN